MTELNPNVNALVRLLDRGKALGAFIVLVSICVIVSIISWVRAEDAIDKANQAAATATTWQTMYKETERECRLAQLELDDWRVKMAEAGIALNHIGESP